MAYTGSSIVDFLKSSGQDSSYSARAKKAAELGIKNYTGSAAQNSQMLNTLRNSKPKPTTTSTSSKPAYSAPTTPETTYSTPAVPKTTYSAPAPTVPSVSSEPKYLWEQDEATGGYQNLNLSTGKREGAIYDQPWGNVTQPVDTALLDRIANLEKMLGQSQQQPAYDINAAKGRIQDWGSELKASMIAKIEAARKTGVNQYANAGTLATQQTKSALDQNAVDKAKAIEQILQASEAAGQGRGGMNISGQIAANTMAQQNANSARTNLSNNLAMIEQGKADVNTQADQSKIGAEADVQAQVLQAIMDAERTAADVNLQSRGLDLQNKQFDFSSGLQTQQFDADQAWRQWQKDFEIENQAWQKSPDNPALQAQVLANKSAILNNQLAELELRDYPEEQKLRMQQLKKEIAQIGRAPATSQYEKDMQNIKLNQAEIELENLRKGLTASGGTPPGTNTDSLYNSTYNTVASMAVDPYYTQAQVLAKIQNTQGLTPQQKADIANAIYPEE